MAVEIKSVGRSRIITGSLYMERWIQIDAGTDIIYGATGDLNRLDALADSSITGSMWYGAPSPGEYDAGESNQAWYGQAFRIPFRRIQASGEWDNLETALQVFVEAAFPGELVVEANRRAERPQPGDLSDPAKYVLWTIEYD